MKESPAGNKSPLGNKSPGNKRPLGNKDPGNQSPPENKCRGTKCLLWNNSLTGKESPLGDKSPGNKSLRNKSTFPMGGYQKSRNKSIKIKSSGNESPSAYINWFDQILILCQTQCQTWCPWLEVHQRHHTQRNSCSRLWQYPTIVIGMAIRVVEFSNGRYKIKKSFA